jgi:hypothetical protein
MKIIQELREKKSIYTFYIVNIDGIRSKMYNILKNCLKIRGMK